MGEEIERKAMGTVTCENCGHACTVFEAAKSGRLSYTCHGCGSQFMARTQESSRRLMERIKKQKKGAINDSKKEDAMQPKPTAAGGSGGSLTDWEW